MKSHTMYWFIFVSTYIGIIYIDTCVYIYIYFIYIYIIIVFCLYSYTLDNKITKTKKKKCRPKHHPLLLAVSNRVFFFPGRWKTSNPSVLHHPNAIRRFEIPEACLGHAKGHPWKNTFWMSIQYKIPCIPLYIPTVFPIFWGAGFWLDTSKYHTPIFCFGWFHSSKICKEFNGLVFSGWKL